MGFHAAAGLDPDDYASGAAGLATAVFVPYTARFAPSRGARRTRWENDGGRDTFLAAKRPRVIR